MDQERVYAAYVGALAADAVAMPVHWYYDTVALDRDYGGLDGYATPGNPHPDSILWRSRYEPLNAEADILHDQARYWGQRGVHYHQFLRAGQNTLNSQLARELHRSVLASGGYEPKAWVERYITCMRTPGWHGDTYAEEYHRAFFTRRAEGKDPMQCGIDDKHIGGLSQVPALVAALVQTGSSDLSRVRETVRTHVHLTHKNKAVLEAADILVRLLWMLAEGGDLEQGLRSETNSSVSLKKFESFAKRPDREIVGRIYSPACYIEDSFPASLYLTWKYRNDFSAGILANALVGGDNCHRGAVVGSLLGAGASAGVPSSWMERFVSPASCKSLSRRGQTTAFAIAPAET